MRCQASSRYFSLPADRRGEDHQLALEGIGYYQQSVRLDPHYALVREYLGEAYVLKGDLASAKYQLRKIKGICGNTECEEYEDLEKAIAGHPEDDG
jgi:protein involved in temperature-dependent protein secretion